jgi:hypothetical protein
VQTAGGERIWVYTAQPSPGFTDVCAGVDGDLLAEGVHVGPVPTGLAVTDMAGNNLLP